ncbi:MAG: autotransporter-associated beta strand repeat-containing protein, partial [Verrucomicrobiota bacterium]
MTTEINPFRSTAISAAAVIFACFTLLSTGVQAADFSYTGSGDHNFTNGTNWNPAATPTFDWSTNLVFGSAVTNGTLNMDSGTVAGSLTLTSGLTQNITINGPGSVGLAGTGVGTSDGYIHMSAAAHDLTINAPLQQMWGDIRWNVGAGRTLTINGGLTGGVWTSGVANLVKDGAGTAVLASAISYSGGTTVNGGTLELNNAIGTIIYTGGNIAINNGATVIFSGANQYWLDGKTIAFGAGGGTFDTGTGMNLVTGTYPTGGTGLTFTTTAGTTSTISGSSGINANGNTETFDVASTGTLNLTSFVWNVGSVIKQGGGTLTLTGANTYSGATTVSAGTLQIGDGTSGHDGSLLTSGITDSGALVYNLYGNQTAGYAISGTGSLIKNGAGTLALTGANTYTGSTTISGGRIIAYYDSGGRVGSGTVTVGGPNSPNTTSFKIWANLSPTLGNNFVLNSMGSAQNEGAINQDGGGGVVTLNGSITLAGDSRIGTGGSSWNSMVINGQISGPGKLYVWEIPNPNPPFPPTQLTLNNGANNYSGGTVIEQGQLNLTQGTPLGTGPVTVNSGATLAPGSGRVTLGSLTLGANATLDLTQPLNASSNSLLQVNGDLVLSGNLVVNYIGGLSPGKVYAIHYTGALTNLGFTTSIITVGKTVLVDTVSTPGYVLFEVGMLNPAAGQNVPMDLAAPLPLGWVPVLGATAYDVYLGTGSSAVAAATTNTGGIYQSRTTAMTMNIASLQPNTTYYWRVDGVAANGTPITGTVYSFTTGAAMVDLMEDTWVATDALGRKLPGHAECGSPRTNRPIGMFYYLWHDFFGRYGDGGTNWDISKILAAHPYTDPHNPWADNPIMQQFQLVNYWWGEPALGYYNATDPWVLRRQIALINHAGVDVLFFDYSNGEPYYYTNELYALCDMILQMRLEGQKINLKIAFLPGYTMPTWLYNNFYSQNKYSDLWYYWQGKPLMLGDSSGLPSTIQNFFTWRKTWTGFTTDQLHDGWQWIDLPTPQNWGYDTRYDLPEEVPVACGSWVGGGRSKCNNSGQDYDNQHLPLQHTSGQGNFFKEQINYGLKYDPELLFITEWNEWIAGSWPAPDDGWPNVLSDPCPKGGFYFVDEYNQEYSRDIEPMKGGHTDNYYFQMVGQNRLRKGVRPVPAASALQTVSLAGGFSQWDSVAPAYYDAVNDTIHRNYDAAAPGQMGTYINTTGRNDFTVLKVARDADNFYFFAQCNSNISSYTDSNWMVLLIDTDQNHATGWEGYDYAVNLGARTATTTTLSQILSTTNDWTWTPVRSDIAYTVSGNQLMLTIPRASLRLGADPAQFDFHWADNFQTHDIADFGVSGDSAPDRRFNYRYNATSNTEVTLLADDFESGKQSAWAETWTNGSRWDLTTASPYTGSTCAVGSNAADGQSDLIARASTAGYGSFRLNFHYKLADVRNVQTLQISYLTADGWVPIKQLSRDEFYPANQFWSYDEQQNVWLNFTDTRYNTGPDTRFFSADFAFRIDASALTGAGQQVFVDAVNLTANTQLPAAV